MSKLKGKNIRVREGFWHFRFKINGEEHTGSTGIPGIARNRKAAEAYARTERRKANGEIEKKQPRPFFEDAAEFLVWCDQVQYRPKPATALRIRSSFRSCIEFFGDADVRTISAGDLERYKQHRLAINGVQEISLRHDLHALSLFFQYEMRMGRMTKNPVKEIRIPSDRDAIREHVVTAEEEDKYFAAAAALHAEHLKSHPGALPNMADLARLMLEQGARPEELLATAKESLDRKIGTLHIVGGKTRAARRTLNLTETSKAILERRLKTDGPWLFPSDRRPGKHITKLQCTHDRICREAGVSFVIYDLRHTFATRAIEAGNPVAVVAAIMGHSGLRTIHRYVHPTSEAQKLAMEKFEAAQQRKKLKVVGK